MVKGLDLFRERFREFEGSFILIGGAACDEWFASEGLTFRPTVVFNSGIVERHVQWGYPPCGIPFGNPNVFPASYMNTSSRRAKMGPLRDNRATRFDEMET
jgi:hypothetical protein